MANNENCTICGTKLNKSESKENRTEHYGCRNVKTLFKKGLDKTCKTREVSAIKTIEKKPNLLSKFFGITL